MNTITAAPTMCNPEAFDTVPELRVELHRANAKLLQVVEQMHDLAIRHNHVLEWCTVLATHHELGQHDQVQLKLDTVVKNKNQKMQAAH